MTKKAKAIVTINFCASTVKRLANPEHGRRFYTLFNGVSKELIPTHAFFFEGRGGRRAVTLEDIETLDFWNSPSGRTFDLQIQTHLKGNITISAHYGIPNAPANWLSVSLDLVPVMKRGLFYNVLRLFDNLIEYTQASHGRAGVSYRSTARYVLVDAPELAVPEPPTWNGVLLVSTAGGPADLTCLPHFGSWINVLGREYVELLGRDKLLSLEVYQKHEDSAGRIWLQITERPEQMHLAEVKEHVKRLVDGLGTPDVFCRKPRTDHERIHGIDPKEYRTPNFDWSELRDDNPYSPRWAGSGIWVGKTQFNTSIGFGRQLLHKQDIMYVLNTILSLITDSKGSIGPFGMALAEDDELLHVRARTPEQRTIQGQADLVTERLARMREQRPIKATGACFYGKGPVPGQPDETTAFKIHLESASGDAYVVYLPFEENGRKREYRTLVIEPGKRVVFEKPKARRSC